jgi:hypothetical protein
MRRHRGLLAVALALFALVVAGCFPKPDDPSVVGTKGGLTTIDSTDDAVPACTRYNGAYLEVVCPATILNRRIVGGVYDTGGQLTMRNVEVVGRGQWFIVAMVNGGNLLVEDANLRRADTTSLGSGAGVIAAGSANVTVRRSTLSGNPDGIQTSRTLLVEDSWIHGLAMVGTYPNNTHNDGIQVFAGTVTVRNSTISIGAKAPYSNAAIFMQGDASMRVRVEGSHLDGGAYTLYCETGHVDWVNSTFGSEHLYGQQNTQGCTTSGL